MSISPFAPIPGLRNFTPHEVVLVGVDGEVLARLPSEGVARVVAPIATTIRVVVIAEAPLPNGGVIARTVPVIRRAYRTVKGLPACEDGSTFVVSRMVAETLRGLREDLVVPSDLIRDSGGRVFGARALEAI